MTMWLDGVETHHGNSAGPMNGDGSRKVLLHSTEGTTIEGAIGAYQANNSWPTMTVDCRRRRVVQHLPLDVAARALRNETGGVETNREGTILVQIELVGFAGTPASIGSPDDLDWLGRDVIAPIHRATGVPLTVGVVFAPYPGSYGRLAGQRLSYGQWDAYDGIVGHQHAPENSHGDPGALDVTRIVAAATAALIPEEDMLSAEDVKAITTAVDRVRPFLAQAPDYAAVWLITRDGTKRWVSDQVMLAAVVKDGARYASKAADGTPLAYPRSREHLASLETVGPVPDGW